MIYRFFGPTSKSPGWFRYITTPYNVEIRKEDSLAWLVWLLAPYRIRRVA